LVHNFVSSILVRGQFSVLTLEQSHFSLVLLSEVWSAYG